MSSPCRLVIVEDVTVVRDLLAEAFSLNRYEVVGTFGTGAEALEAIPKLRPDVVVLDYVLPDVDGLEIARRLMPKSETRFLLITAHESPEVLARAVQLGIHGVVTKGSALRVLREAVDRVMTVGAYLCPEAASALRQAGLFRREPALTAREREVLVLIASGLSSKQIALRLSLSEKTVGNHRSNLMKKLDLHDVASVTRYAIERGMVPARSRK